MNFLYDKSSLACVADALNLLYTAISRKVDGKKVHAVFQKGNMGYDPYTVSDIVAVQPTFAASL